MKKGILLIGMMVAAIGVRADDWGCIMITFEKDGKSISDKDWIKDHLPDNTSICHMEYGFQGKFNVFLWSYSADALWEEIIKLNEDNSSYDYSIEFVHNGDCGEEYRHYSH